MPPAAPEGERSARGSGRLWSRGVPTEDKGATEDEARSDLIQSREPPDGKEERGSLAEGEDEGRVERRGFLRGEQESAAVATMRKGRRSSHCYESVDARDADGLREDVGGKGDPDRRELRLHQDEADAEAVEQPTRLEKRYRERRSRARDELGGNEGGEVELEGGAVVERAERARQAGDERKEEREGEEVLERDEVDQPGRTSVGPPCFANSSSRCRKVPPSRRLQSCTARRWSPDRVLGPRRWRGRG